MTKQKEIAALTKCFFCLEAGNILIHRRLKDISELNGKVVDMTPCSKCAEWMKQGIILMGIDAEKSAPEWNKQRIPNPYRTGEFVVIKSEPFQRMVNDEACKTFGLEHRWMFMESAAMRQLGLVKEASNEPK